MDILDELARRNAVDKDDVVVPAYLPTIEHLHPKRNQGRATLGRLSSRRFGDFLMDTHWELSRRTTPSTSAPRLASSESTAT